MKARIKQTLLAILLLVFPATLGCGGDSSTAGAKIEPTWIGAQVEGDAISIPLSEVDSGKMVHFTVTNGGTDMTFMAYALGGQVYVRAATCPPCRAESFSLAGGALDCDSCHTRFKADTGEGISGACKGYPKAEAAYTIDAGKMTMDLKDLVRSYEDTLRAG